MTARTPVTWPEDGHRAEERDGDWYCVNHDRKMEPFEYGAAVKRSMWVCKAEGCANHVHPPIKPDRTCRECGKVGFASLCRACAGY